MYSIVSVYHEFLVQILLSEIVPKNIKNIFKKVKVYSEIRNTI